MIQKFAKLLFILIFAFGLVNGQDSTAKPKKARSIAAIPMINYNRTQGAVIGALVSKYYKINKQDTISPTSSTGIMGIYTQEKSYVFTGYARLYFAEDRWRITAAAGT